MTFAVVPAAGKGTRMGREKLTLPLGGRTILERVVGALREGGVEHVLVVLGPHVGNLVPLAEHAGAEAIVATEETSHMRTTIETGLEHLRQRFNPADKDLWMLAPADHPMLNSTVTAALIETAIRQPAHSIYIPTYCSRRGHPVLFRWKHSAAIRTFAADKGINEFVRSQSAEVRELRVMTHDILFDMDTMEDYERLLRM